MAERAFRPTIEVATVVRRIDALALVCAFPFPTRSRDGQSVDDASLVRSRANFFRKGAICAPCSVLANGLIDIFASDGERVSLDGRPARDRPGTAVRIDRSRFRFSTIVRGSLQADDRPRPAAFKGAANALTQCIRLEVRTPVRASIYRDDAETLAFVKVIEASRHVDIECRRALPRFVERLGSGVTALEVGQRASPRLWKRFARPSSSVDSRPWPEISVRVPLDRLRGRQVYRRWIERCPIGIDYNLIVFIVLRARAGTIQTRNIISIVVLREICSAISRYVGGRSVRQD